MIHKLWINQQFFLDDFQFIFIKIDRAHCILYILSYDLLFDDGEEFKAAMKFFKRARVFKLMLRARSRIGR